MITKLFVTLATLMIAGQNISADQSATAFTVSGIVKDKTTGEPIQYVHVFTVKGEEEAITDQKGRFAFQTWKPSAELVTEREGYRSSVVKLSLPVQTQTILLAKE